MAGLVRNRAISYQRIPGPEGMTGEQASSVYLEGPGAYPEMPMPATQFATSATALQSLDIVPSVAPAWTNAPVVQRNNRMNGYLATGGFSDRDTGIPPMYDSPYSSKFQPMTIGFIVNYVKNACLYRAGVPAGVGIPGRWHGYLSTRVDQLVTRSTGGPGPAAMTTPQRRFQRVQTIPRYSTMPQSYNTESAPG